MSYLIRPFRNEDLDSFVKYANNPNVASNMTDRFPHPYSRKDGEEFFKRALSQEPTQLFTIEVEGESAGAVGIHPCDDISRLNAEIGYWVAEPYWGRGIAAGAVLWIVEYGFQSFEIERIFARPFGHNLASQKVLEKAGFKLEARFNQNLIKNGQRMDELIYGMYRS